MENMYDKKQICFRYETDLEHSQDHLAEAVEHMLPKGSEVTVKRGNHKWNVTVVGVDTRRHAGYFRAESANGKIHTFYYKDVII